MAARIWGCAFALLAYGAVAKTASASVIVTFDYSASAFASGSPPEDFTIMLNSFPTGGAQGVSGAFDIDTGVNDFASVVGFGQTEPALSYGAGAVAAGTANASAQTTTTFQITNDDTVARNGVWSFLIYNGGVGFANADLDNCTPGALESCDTYGAAPSFLANDEVAETAFSIELSDSTGVQTLLGGVATVTNAGASFTGDFDQLQNFGLASGNQFFYLWDETIITQSLGLFAPGETKILTFTSTNSVVSDGGCDEGCTVGLAGFGDPPGNDGGIVMYRSFVSQSTFPTIPPNFINGAVIFDNDIIEAPVAGAPPMGEVPAPGAIVFVLLGISGLYAARRRTGELSGGQAERR
ncbi:MAG: hypothetical protein Tsb0010_09100 [Parvularculaceae bacterium]